MVEKRPCKRCRKPECEEMECDRWREWFLDSWAAVNNYAWRKMDELGREEPGCFRYELPHLVKSPCEVCPCGSWCDTPCSLRLRWWDARIGRLRHAAR